MSAVASEALAPPPITHDRWRPSTAGWAARLGVLVLVFGGVLWITAAVQDFWADRIALAAIYAIIGLSLNIILGYVGQVSLGHHGFVGIAAFASAYYATESGGCSVAAGCGLGDFAIGTAIAAAGGAVAAGLMGMVALRIKGLYLALITLSFGLMAETSIFEIEDFTGGGGGRPAPRPDGFTTDQSYAFLCLAVLAVILFVDWRLTRSKAGRAILSLKHSEPVAASYGVNVTAYKVIAFMLSGVFAGIAGSLFAFRNENVVSNDFNFNIALLWVLMVVIGGLGSRTGVVIGSSFIALFPFLLPLLPGVGETLFERPIDFFQLALGATLATITIVSYPGGIAEQVSPITRWLGGKRFSMHPEGHGEHKEETAKKSLKARLGLSKEHGKDEATSSAEGSPEPERDEVRPEEREEGG